MSWSRIMLAVASPGDVESPATEKAARLAQAFGAELEIFHCVFDSDVARPGRFASRGAQLDIREIVEQRHKQLDHNAERLRAQGINVATSVRWDYPPYEGIVRQLTRHESDLLIIQGASKGRAARLVLTHTDFKLIESCPCAMLLIKTTRPYSPGRILAAVDPTHAHAKPAALDRAILESARAVSSALAGELLIFHARTPWADVVRADPALQAIPQMEQADAHRGYCERVLRGIRELADPYQVAPEQIHVIEGAPEDCLPAFAHSERADIVTMGAVSRSFLKRVLIGHTAERLLDALDCDVLIAKAPGFRSPVSRTSAHRVDLSVARRGKYIL